jgi:probable rRNA maturation factor
LLSKILNLVTIKKRVSGLREATLARFILRAKRAAKLRGEVSVLVTSDHELRELNQRFRGKNKTTDVLSFPADAVGSNELAGDVAISAQTAIYNAQRLGHTAAQEVEILALHGILHLAGYDHVRDNGQMASREAHLRRALRLPMGLIERNSHSARRAQRAHPRKRRGAAQLSR